MQDAGNEGIYTVTLAETLTYFFAAVWLVNGLCCKLLNMVPRHRAIVARVLGDRYAVPMTRMIGAAEIMMAIWIVTGFQSRWNAVTQIAVVTAMNVIEVILAPDLLLWGRMNAVVAALFVMLIAYNEFFLA